MNVFELGNIAARRLLMAQGVVSDNATVLGHRLHFYRVGGIGNGPPLLLVHGLGSSANAFFRTLKPLAKRFSAVYAVDLPGNGFSPLPDSGPLPLRGHVDVLREFRRTIIGEKVFLVGNSLGGGMSFYFAEQEPEALVALGLVAPAGAQLSDASFAKLISGFDVKTRAAGRAFAKRLFAKAPFPTLVFSGGFVDMLNTPTVLSIVSEVKPADAMTAEALSKLTMPLLLLWGEQERVLPYESIDFYRAHLPSTAEVHIVPHFGHMPQMEHPHDFVDHVIRFAEKKGLV